MADEQKKDFYRKVIALDRKRLTAVLDKLDEARADRNIHRMASLADIAAKIAARYQMMLDNLL